MGQQRKALPALPLFQKLNSLVSCTGCQRDLLPIPARQKGRCKEDEEAPLLHTQLLLCLHTETREKPPDGCLLPRTPVSVQVRAFVIDVEWQGQGIPLTIMQPLSDVSCYQHHPETSTTLVPRKISEVGCSTPVKGRTKLLYFNVFVQQRLWQKAKTYWRASDSEVLLWQLFFF